MSTATESGTGRIPAWTLGDRLRKARETAGYGQVAFAAATGIGQRSIVNYENDQRVPSRPVLLAWSVATGVPLAWLRDGSTAATGEYRRSRRHLRLIPPVPLTATG